MSLSGSLAILQSYIRLVVLHVRESNQGRNILGLCFVLQRLRIKVDVDDLWQTVYPASISNIQAQQLQIAVLISNCWSNRVD